MSAAPRSSPGPRLLSDEERALWEKDNEAVREFLLAYCKGNPSCAAPHAELERIIAWRDSLLTALSTAREAGEEAKALHTIRETMATPGFRVSLHFDGAGMVGLEWWGGSMCDEEESCLAEVDCQNSVLAAVAEAMTQLGEDSAATSTETPHE